MGHFEHKRDWDVLVHSMNTAYISKDVYGHMINYLLHGFIFANIKFCSALRFIDVTVGSKGFLSDFLCLFLLSLRKHKW